MSAACSCTWARPTRSRIDSAISYHVKAWESYLLILSTLARLPKLCSLFLVFLSHIGKAIVALDQFSDLTEIQLASISLSTENAELVTDMIRRCPGLRRVGITTWRWGPGLSIAPPEIPPMDLGRLFPANYRSRVTHLSLAKDCFTVSSSSIRFLGFLSHLHIRNTHNVSPSFWGALQSEGVELKSLATYPLTPPVVAYLTSYSGLIDLRLIHSKTSNGVADDLSRDFFFNVLPCHQATLQHLYFGPHLPFRIWSITEEHLDPILSCHLLKTLHLLFRHPSEYPFGERLKTNGVQSTPFISLYTLLSRITASLPVLQRLTLKPTPGYHPTFGPDSSPQASYTLLMKSNFPFEISSITLDAVVGNASSPASSSLSSKAAASSPQFPSFQLAVAHHPDYCCLFDRESRRFKWTRPISQEEIRLVRADSEMSDD